MKNSISYDDKWVKHWLKKIISLAQNNDLNSHEVDTYTDKLVEKTTIAELSFVVKEPLNCIIMHK